MRRRASCAVCVALLLASTGRADDAKPAGPAPAPFTCSRPALPALPREATAEELRELQLRGRLREIECELDRRAQMPDSGRESCYFGPEWIRISNERYEEIRQARKDDPVELWHALLREPEDPNLPPIEIRITSKSGPSCRTDRDRQLEAEADAILKALNFR